jgi:hypothetical protein
LVYLFFVTQKIKISGPWSEKRQTCSVFLSIEDLKEMGAQQSSGREGYATPKRIKQRGAEHCPTAYVDSLTNQPVYKLDSNDRCILNRDMVGATNGAGLTGLRGATESRVRRPI